jgi:hypothetical protein
MKQALMQMPVQNAVQFFMQSSVQIVVQEKKCADAESGCRNCLLKNVLMQKSLQK